MDATIPVNTFVGMGTLSIFHTAPIHRSFHSGCVQTRKSILSISSGAPIRVFLRKRELEPEPRAVLLNGDVIEILSICGNAPRADPLILALDTASSDKNVIWRRTAALPDRTDFGASWRIVDTAVPLGQPLEIFQSVRLLSAQYPDQAVSVYMFADVPHFRLAPFSGTTATPSHTEQLASATPVPNAVEFYISTPHYLPTAHIPAWVLSWFPRHSEGKETWLTSWSQHSPLHTSQRKKWDSIRVSKIPVLVPVPAPAPTPSPSPTAAWTETHGRINIADMWKASRTTSAVRAYEPVRKWK